MLKNGIRFFSLPGEIRNQLTSKELQVFYLIFDLFHIRSKNFPFKPVYAFPSEAWLAERVGCSREWVSNCVQRLQDFKLITITHRRKVRGNWQTNLYRFGMALAHCLKRACTCYSSALNHVNKTSHIAKDFIINQLQVQEADMVPYDIDEDVRAELAALRGRLAAV